MTVAHWGSYCLIDEGRGVRLEPDVTDEDPSRIGAGWVSAARDKKARVLRPAIRKGWLAGDGGRGRNEDAFVELPWDEALDIAAKEITQVSQRHGNNAIFGGSYGWASAGRFHHAQSQLRRFLNLVGGYVGAKNTYSHASAEVLFPHIVGLTNKQIEEGLTSWPLIADHCGLFLSFGGVSGRTAQIASGGTARHEVDSWLRKAGANGMQAICISPLQSDLKALPAADWLAIRPGTDVALMLALSCEILKAGQQDQEFLDRYTSGFGSLRDYLLGASDGVVKSAEWAAPICDIPAEVIASLARRLPKEKVMVSVAWGLQRSDHGEQAVWAGLALACVLGQIGQLGTGFGFGYGSTTPLGRPKRFVSWPTVPQGSNPIRDYIPVARLADMLLHPGESYTYDGDTRQYPDIRLVYWCGGNPFHHHQDLGRLERAWQRPETVIVQDHSWTATAKRADIVLSATTPLEREDLFINRRDPDLIYMHQAFAPMGEARNDHQIFKDLAQRLGVEEDFAQGRDEEEWLNWLWQRCQITAQAEGFALPGFEDFRELGHFTIPEPDQTRVLFDKFIADPQNDPLNTESGKITLTNQFIEGQGLGDCPGHPTWLEPAEWLGRADPDEVHLLSNQPVTRLHSQLDNGSESKSGKVKGREVCTLHSDLAARLGVVADDVVRLFNDRGSCLAAVALSDGQRADCVVLPTGAWLDLQTTQHGRICVHGNPNMLTIDRGASGFTQGNIAYTTLVRIEKWTGTLPEISAFSPPDFVSRGEEGTEVQRWQKNAGSELT